MGRTLKDAEDVMVWRKKAKLMEDSLKRIISANHSSDQVERAEEYLRDIESFRNIIPASTRVVSRRDFDNIIKESDIAEVEKTDYIHFATTQTFPSVRSRTCAWMAPITSL